MDKRQAQFDQDVSLVADYLTAVWLRMYSNLIAGGMNESQAMQMVLVFIAKGIT